MHIIVDWLRSHIKLIKLGLPVAIIGLAAILGVTVLAYSHAATAPSLYMDPSTGTAAPDSEISITVHENSGSDTVAAVQSVVGYDQTQLQFEGFTEQGPFNQILSSNFSTPGRVSFARGVPLSAQAVSGDNIVVTLKFKVIANTGSAALSFDDSHSIIATSTDSQNVFSTSQGATLAISGGSNNPTGSLSLSPASVSQASGNTFTVTVNEDSGTSFLAAVQTKITYDPAQLQYTGMSEGTVFTTQLSTNTSTAGTITLARGLPLGGSNSGVSGQNAIVKLTFKVIGTSGTANITIDKAHSMLSSVPDATNILSTVGNSMVTIQSTNSHAATLSMQPASGQFASGSTLAVTVYADGGASGLNTAEVGLTYPTSQLQFVNATDSTVYPTAMRTNNSGGRLDVIRGIPFGTTALNGKNPVVTLNFKVIGTSGTADLAFDDDAGLYDDSGTGNNVLDLTQSFGGSYTITGTPSGNCTANPSTPGQPVVGTVTGTSVSLSWSASTAASGCTLGGYHVLRDGTSVGDVTNGTAFQDSGLTSGRSYSYAVQAFDTSGHVSAASGSISVTTQDDNQAPTTPTGVTGGAPNSAAVVLNWTASTDLPNPGGSGVAGYHIYRNGAATPTYTVTHGTTYTDADVTAGATYTYTVTAYDNADNESAPSNIVSVTTPAAACSGTPSTPAGLTITSVDMTTASFSWSPSTASDGCQLIGYKIYRGSTYVGAVTDAAFTDTGLTPNTIYAYTVKAYDSSAHTSSASDPLTVTTTDDSSAPSAPANVTATAISAGQVALSWDASTDAAGVTGYRVYRDGTRVATVDGTVHSYTDTSLTPNTDYRYEVTAIDAAGNESSKAPATPSPVHTPTSTDSQAPSMPGNVHVLAVTNDTVSFSWDASTDNVGVIGYKVYRGTDLLGMVTTTSYTDTGLTSDTDYSYTVKAVDASGNMSTASDPLAAHTLSDNSGALLGDLNGDSKVDIYDLSIMMSNWQQQDVPASKGDLDASGTVDEDDLLILLGNYGQGE